MESMYIPNEGEGGLLKLYLLGSELQISGFASKFKCQGLLIALFIPSAVSKKFSKIFILLSHALIQGRLKIQMIFQFV